MHCLDNDTFASLKLRRSASLLAPTSCTLAMDITLPKSEKDATCSSFSLRDLESVWRKSEVHSFKFKSSLMVKYELWVRRLCVPEDLSAFDVLWNKDINVTHISKKKALKTWHNEKSQVDAHGHLHVVDNPVDKQLRCSCNDQVLLLAGYEVAVDGKLHCSGGVRLSVHSIHPGGLSSASERWEHSRPLNITEKATAQLRYIQ